MAEGANIGVGRNRKEQKYNEDNVYRGGRTEQDEESRIAVITRMQSGIVMVTPTHIYILYMRMYRVHVECVHCTYTRRYTVHYTYMYIKYLYYSGRIYTIWFARALRLADKATNIGRKEKVYNLNLIICTPQENEAENC